MDEKKYFELTDDQGNKTKAEILFTHHSDKFNKDYVVFLPEDDEQYSAASYIEGKDGYGNLEPIESDEEWKLLEDLLNDYFDDSNDEEEDN